MEFVLSNLFMNLKKQNCKLLIVFYFLLFFSSSFSQTIKGTVTDSVGPVPFANILIKNKNSIKQFTKTNEKGFYSIQLKENIDSLYVEVTSFPHLSEAKLIKKTNFVNNELELNFKLNKKINTIEEVLIVKKMPITVKNDTTTYDPESFKDGTEKVIEDLLKKLPGVTVENNGEIKFKGKTIKKMLLDGDDLFDANYAIGSRNINVNMIEKVQGLENFDENSLLKGIRDSEDVALNIVLKKGKTDLSANTTLGYGTNNRYYGNVSGVVVNKKMKGFGIASYNNIGQNTSPYDFDSEIISLENLRNRNSIAPSLINDGSFYSALDNSFHRLNNNFYTSLNSLNKLFKNTTLRANLGFYTDKLQRFNQSKTTVFSNNANFGINEINSLLKSPELYDFKLLFANKEKLNFHWELISKFNYNTVNFNDFSTNNTIVQNNIVKSENYTIDQQLNSTYKISENKSLISSIIYTKSKSPQSLLTSPGTSIDNSNNLIASKQNSEFIKDFFNINLSYYLSKNKFKYGIHSSFFRIENSLQSNLLNNTNQSLGVAFENETNYKIDNLNLNPVFVYNEEKYAIKIGANATYNKVLLQDINVTENKSNLFIAPKFNAVYKFTKKKSVSFNYSFNQILPEEDKMFSGIVQTSYRGFVSNNFSLENLKTHSYNLNFSHNDFFNLTQFNVGISHNYRPNNYFYNTVINQNITVSNRFYANVSNKDYGLNISGEKYFHPFRTTFQLNTNLNLSFDNNIINNSQTREIRNETFFVNFVGRRKLKENFVFENKVSFLNNNSIIEKENINNNFQSLNNQTKIIYKTNNQFNASIVGNLLVPNLQDKNNTYFFLETEINYQPKNKKVSYSLVAKNLTNNKSFQITSVSDYSTTISSHNLIERYIMFKITFGF